MCQVDVEKIKKLNQNLIEIERKILHLAIEEDGLALKKINNKSNGITDYELSVSISFYQGENEVIDWEESLKGCSVNKSTNFADAKNHNTTSCCWENTTLNEQHHCWVLHRLYDDFQITWKDILTIDCVWFDVYVQYQYKSIVI